MGPSFGDSSSIGRTLYPIAAFETPFSFNVTCVWQQCQIAWSITVSQAYYYTLFRVEDELHSLHLVSYFRLLQKDKNSLEALRMLALHSLCRDGDVTEVKFTVSHVHSLNWHGCESAPVQM